MKQILKTLIAFAVCVAASGCVFFETTSSSSDVNQSKIYQSYYVNYDGATTSASATFYLDSSENTTLQLIAPAAVSHNGQAMGGYEDPIFGGYSYNDSASGFVAQHTFVFLDGEGNTFTNTATMPSVAFSNPPASLSQSAGMTQIAYTGDPLIQNDSLMLSLYQQQGQGQVSRVFYGNSLSGGEFTIYSSDLVDFLPGVASIKLSRSRGLPLQQANIVGGEIEFDFASALIQVQITR